MEKTVLKKFYKYYTHCMLQMAVTGIIKNNFVVRTSQEMIVDEIYFDNEFWVSMKANFKKYYEHLF